MPNYCTVCGVKLTAKNKISYRPSSCRDCELERKRLYSLKRKIQNELEEKSSKAVKPASKASPSTSKAAKSTSKAVKSTHQVLKSPSKATKEVVLKPKLTKLEESKSTKVKKTPETKNKKIEKPVVIEPKAKTVKLGKKLTDKKKPTNSSAKVVAITKAESSTTKKKTVKGAKEEDIDESGLIEDPDIEIVETPVVVKSKSGSALIVIPSYIKEAAKIKVKKRRLGKLPAVRSKNISSLNSDSQSEDVSSVFALGENLTEEDLLRAPSNTPWESSSFKIVDGSFVEHGAEDQDEAKGPSPEEIKNIIEKIRLEHKTRRG
jgi:hypothetical protein